MVSLPETYFIDEAIQSVCDRFYRVKLDCFVALLLAKTGCHALYVIASKWIGLSCSEEVVTCRLL
jgi:hypothetical protein